MGRRRPGSVLPRRRSHIRDELVPIIELGAVAVIEDAVDTGR